MATQPKKKMFVAYSYTGRTRDGYFCQGFDNMIVNHPYPPDEPDQWLEAINIKAADHAKNTLGLESAVATVVNMQNMTFLSGNPNPFAVGVADRRYRIKEDHHD